MEITYKRLKDITYPAFRLSSSSWEFKDGLLYLDGKILDDTNMPGETLGIRRLQTPMKGLYKLKNAYEFPIAIIKEKAGWYIDSKGKIFKYIKTKFCKLKYYKIQKVELKTTHSLLWVHRVNFPIKIPRPPGAEYTWAGMLLLEGLPWLLYEYSTEKLKETRRKV